MANRQLSGVRHTWMYRCCYSQGQLEKIKQGHKFKFINNYHTQHAVDLGRFYGNNAIQKPHAHVKNPSCLEKFRNRCKIQAT